MKIYRSYSSAETQKLGKFFARKTLRSGLRKRGAAIFALSGELGSGKTTFVQGFLHGLGVKRGGTSPTFILMRRHALRGKRFKNAYHIDAYRIKNPGEFLKLDLKEILEDSKNIVLIEWAEKLRRFLPRGAVQLRFRHDGREENRSIWFNN
ncbi:MAG: tRNA (adenosine(37)-N6)-threonylcarbamoyltransferase complex ATPase subunit type 1 TsaE [bacterium]|nr:tRNA (adenosine(37)-N6)-threonylcarbamoyltransferase complex ATPase subunit type 1 TsaE [bacterium]